MRKIIHVDMDCFYAAVEEKYNPKLKGKPVGVGGPANSRSVLCTANYEARKFGVRAAMPSSMALKKCPQLVLVPPQFSLYKKESSAVRQILEQFTLQIEPLSLDEAYLDVSEVELCKGSATLMAAEIKKMIQQELGLTASAGIAPNKFLAKIASDWKKPNGIFTIRPQDVESFVPSLPIEKLYGVGKVTAQFMHKHKFFTCADLQRASVPVLYQLFGSRAKEFYDLCRGIDHRPVVTSAERKSVTVEETFEVDLPSMKELKTKIPSLYQDFIRRIDQKDYKSRIKSAVVKLKFSDFKSTTKEVAMTDLPTIELFEKLLAEAWERQPMAIRLAGLGVRLSSEKKSSNADQLELTEI